MAKTKVVKQGIQMSDSVPNDIEIVAMEQDSIQYPTGIGGTKLRQQSMASILMEVIIFCNQERMATGLTQMSIGYMIDNAFALNSSLIISKIIDDIIARSPLKLSMYYALNKPYFEKDEETSHNNVVQKNIRYFIDPRDQNIPKMRIIITLFDSMIAPGSTRIVIQNPTGQVLIELDPCPIQKLSNKCINALKNIANYIVIENNSSLFFDKLKPFPYVFTQDIEFAWVQRARSNQNRTQALYTHEMLFNRTFKIITRDKLRFIFHDKQQKITTRSYEFEMLFKNIRTVRKYVDALINRQAPTLKNSNYTFLPSLIQNMVLFKIKFVMPNQQTQISFYHLLNRMVETLIDKARISNSQLCDFSQHYPYLIDYSKYCVACKLEKKIIQKDRTQDEKLVPRKSKYACIGCTRVFKTEIRLCVCCFERFHFNMYRFMGVAERVNIKKAMQNFNVCQKEGLNMGDWLSDEEDNEQGREGKKDESDGQEQGENLGKEIKLQNGSKLEQFQESNVQLNLGEQSAEMLRNASKMLRHVKEMFGGNGLSIRESDK